jgi:toxin ParE1/3/4
VKLRFTPRATRDLAEIAEYLRTRNPSAALAVRDAILRSLQNLTLFPAIGRPQDVQGVRKLGTPKYRYLVYPCRASSARSGPLKLTIFHCILQLV